MSPKSQIPPCSVTRSKPNFFRILLGLLYVTEFYHTLPHFHSCRGVFILINQLPRIRTDIDARQNVLWIDSLLIYSLPRSRMVLLSSLKRVSICDVILSSSGRCAPSWSQVVTIFRIFIYKAIQDSSGYIQNLYAVTPHMP